LIALLLVTAVALAYAPVRSHGFVNLDDPEYVYDNPRVTAGLTGESVAWAFTAVHSANWHPLTWLSHMLDCELFGLDAGSHHLTSVVLHALASLCLFAALRAMTGARWPSAFVAALFALHPRNVESVAWISERKDVLSALFWTAAMWAYSGYVRRPAIGRYLAVVGLFALGLLAKPMVVTFPFALLLLDVWPLGRTSLAAPAGPIVLPTRSARTLVLEKLPLLALSAASAIVTFLAQSRSGAVTSLDLLPIGTRVANALVAYATYLWKTVSPTGLAVFYPYRNPVPTGEVVVSLIVLVAVSAVAIRAARRRPYLLVGWLWYLGTLVPVIGLVRAGEQSMADRFTYLPLIGIFLAVTWGALDLASRSAPLKKLLPPAAAGAILALTIATRGQVAHWRDSVTLFEHALAVTERNHLAELNLSAALAERGRMHDALVHAEEAVRLRPGEVRALVNRGVARAGIGDADGARASYQEALRADQSSTMAHLNLALLLAEQERWAEAGEEYDRVLRIDPAHAKAHAGLGWVLARQGRTEEAIAQYRIAVSLNPRLSAASNGLALGLEETGHRGEAVLVWQAALRLDPREGRLRHNLAAALNAAGRSREAEAEYRALIDLEPQHVEARMGLADLLVRLGRPSEAAAELRAARAAALGAGRGPAVSEIDARLQAIGRGGSNGP
jgi:protein O-mannosyl-transferase